MDECIESVAEHGLNRCLEALGVSKGPWHYRIREGSKRAERKARDEALRAPVVEVIREHRSYGYRRIRPDVEGVTGEVVNGERLRRLLNEWDLNLHRTTARSSPSEIRRILKQAEAHSIGSPGGIRGSWRCCPPTSRSSGKPEALDGRG